MADDALVPRPPLPAALLAEGVDKAATFLLTVGQDAANEIFRHLGEAEVRQLSTAMARLRTIRRDRAAAVQEEAWRWLSSREGFLIDGEQFVRSLLAARAASGAGRDQKMMRELAPDSAAGALAGALEPVPPKVIGQVLGAEHPQVIAFVLANIPPRQAAEVLAVLPEEQQADVVFRMADLKGVSEELIVEVGAVLKEQMQSLGGAVQAQAIGGTKIVADIVNLVDSAVEDRVLTYLDEQSPELAETVRNLMLTFEDLSRLENREMQQLLKEIPREDLLLALKTASQGMKDKIFGNISKAAAEILKDDLSMMGPVKLKDVEKAQTNIVAIARRLGEEGKINLGGGGEDLV